MLNLLLFGARGQLGWELERTLAPLGGLLACDLPQVDFRQIDQVQTLVREFHPTIIINASAYTDVDRAEQEPDLANTINAQAPGVLADLANEVNASLIHYSTDYVFNGAKGSAYNESDLPDPLSVYGKSKLVGEQFVAHACESYLIFRTSWVYSLRRDSFVTKVLKMAHHQDTLSIVTDQVGSPTWARMIAEITALVLAKSDMAGDPVRWISEYKGLYHLAGDGQTSRYEWAQSIIEHMFIKEKKTVPLLKPALTADFPTPAKRPLFSALDCTKFKKTFGFGLPPWQASLSLAMDDFLPKMNS